MNHQSFPHLLLIVCLVLWCSLTTSALAATITVTTTGDSGNGSLRNALASAANGDTIDATGVSGVIVLTGGELSVDKSVTLLGPGPGALVVSGNFATRVFHISKSNLVVNIAGLTIGAGETNGVGGGIFNFLSTVTVSNCTIRLNEAREGSGIYNEGSGGTATLVIAGSTIAHNTSSNGGGIYNDGSFGNASLTLVSSTVGTNSARRYAGGIYNNGVSGNATLTVIHSTLNGNFTQVDSSQGGAIYSRGNSGSATLTVVNSTLSANRADASGGAIQNDGENGNAKATVLATTFSDNVADSGGIILNDGNDGTATLELGGCILNAAPFGGTIFNANLTNTVSLGYNLSSLNDQLFLGATGDQVNAKPKLGPLQNNGGPTLTHALLEGSPAIEAGTNFSGSATDQRGTGFARTYDFNLFPNISDGTDIGAIEMAATPIAITSSNSARFAADFPNAFQFTATAFPTPAIYVTGTLPAGIGLSLSNILSGVPPVESVGNHPLTIIASNGVAPMATQHFTLTIVAEVALLELAARPNFATNGFGWALNGDTNNGGLMITNNVFPLTYDFFETRSGWFFVPLYVGAFQASFVYQDVGGLGADGVAFVIQSDPQGTNALGSGGGGLGYELISSSVGLLLNIFDAASGGPGLQIGTNGVIPGSYQSTAPVNLAGGNPIAVGLRYAGGVLEVSLTDTVTSANFQTNILVDIPAHTGTNAAWVGITGASGGIASHQTVSNFIYRPLPTLAVRQGQPGSLLFTWPASVYGFTLQMNSSLNNPAGWTAVGQPVTRSNGLRQVTIPLPTGPRFYRLFLPASP